MDIIKKTNGQVWLVQSGNLEKILPATAIVEVKSANEIIVKQGMNQFTSIFVSEIDNYQIEPASPIAFSGNVYDLMLILSNFFFELTGTGATPDLDDVLSVGNSAGIYDIDMNLNDINNVSIIDFDSTTTANPATGQIGWNDSFGTLGIGLKGGAIQAQLGQQEFARVVNKTTPLIALQRANYQVCIVTGATGQRLSVRLAQADSDANSAGTLGIVAEDIAQNQEGFIATTGTLDNLNTTGSLQGETWSDGDILYLSPTTAGAITNVKPTAPNHTVIVGYVEYSHINNGKIYVKIDNGYELDELHNVAITSEANGNYLEYNGTIWVNKGIVYTVELVDALTVNFYAPYNMKINSVSNILNSPTITIQDDGVAYTLTNTIASGSKITVTANTASVVNLNITKA